MSTAVVDLGMGNVGSVANMLTKLGGAVHMTSDANVLDAASRIVLPGVGSFDAAATSLDDLGLADPIRAASDRGTPVLGICLGMQLLADSSEEGRRTGLGLIPGRVVRLPSHGPDGKVTIPHMGWSHLELLRDDALTSTVDGSSRFYFVHSYVFEPRNPEDRIANASHRGLEFCAAVGRRRTMGVQFHPEKSHRHGMALLRSFIEMT